MIQIWVNVSKIHKWDEPFYQSATKEEQPLVAEQDGVELRLASGDYEGKIGPMKSFSPVVFIIGTIEKRKRVQLVATPEYWTLLYIAKGSLCVNQESIEQHNLIVFEQEQDEIIVYAKEDAQILFLSGEVINEPVAAKDNFVMNTEKETNQAILDYKNGLFGIM